MKFSIRAGELREHIYAYPTFASDIKHMLGRA
jgi:glutathione reductase (NADPH)